MALDLTELDALLTMAIREDVGAGDVTCAGLPLAGLTLRGRLVAREPGVLAGQPVVDRLLTLLGSGIRSSWQVGDGEPFTAGATLATLEGPAPALLVAERTLLNLLGRLTGIASAVRRYVDAVEGTGAAIVDTRKTTPGWRRLEKYAVRAGGGQNHRLGLYDQVMVKDNHLALLGPEPLAALAGPIARWRADQPGMCIELELDRLEDLGAALELGVDIVLLDNMSPQEIAAAVEQTAAFDGPRPLLEASGGITLDNVAGYARAGADRIAIGALTHSVPATDIGLDCEALQDEPGHPHEEAPCAP